jgi:hypothetical protein
MFRRLADRFWAWENRRRDPAEELTCAEFGGEFLRRDAVGKVFDSAECADAYAARTAW